MRRALALFAVAVTAGCGTGSSSWKVHPDGRIGPLKIDVSTEAQVRDFAGKPFKVQGLISPPKEGVVGRELYYRCGRGCITSYSISNATGRLSDYYLGSPRFVTEHGSHVGMPVARAAKLERRKVVGGCAEGHYIQLRMDEHHIFALGVFAGKVSSIVYQGPHTLSYEGLC